MPSHLPPFVPHTLHTHGRPFPPPPSSSSSLLPLPALPCPLPFWKKEHFYLLHTLPLYTYIFREGPGGIWSLPLHTCILLWLCLQFTVPTFPELPLETAPCLPSPYTPCPSPPLLVSLTCNNLFSSPYLHTAGGRPHTTHTYTLPFTCLHSLPITTSYYHAFFPHPTWPSQLYALCVYHSLAHLCACTQWWIMGEQTCLSFLTSF